MNFRCLQQCGITLMRVDTTDNIADIMTKVLSAQRVKHLLEGILEGSDNEKQAIVAHYCQASGTTDIGAAAAALTCGCASSRLLRCMVFAAMIGRSQGQPLE